MSTERLYFYRDDYVTANASKITEVKTKDGCDVISVSASCFFPEGGGQPSDIGMIFKCDSDGNVLSSFEVNYVYDEPSTQNVYHITNAPEGTFSTGDSVFLEIDYDNRMVNTTRHSAEHMLSGACHRLYRGVNRGFHMGEDYVTIDIDLGGRMFEDKEIRRLEDNVNEAIRTNYPVTVSFFDSYEESRVMPVRKDVPHDGMVSVVTIGGVFDEELDGKYEFLEPYDIEDGLEEMPYDCIACCGTHVQSTGEIGLLKIYKVEANKGMNRIYFDCGKKAFEKLRADFDTLTDISNQFSCKNEDVSHKISLINEKTVSMKERISALTAFAVDKEIENFLNLIESSEDFRAKPILEYSIFETDELMKLGFNFMNIASDLQFLMLIDDNTNTVFLYSRSPKIQCGQLVKEFAPKHEGKGGGRNDNARALFNDIDSARLFSESVALNIFK